MVPLQSVIPGGIGWEKATVQVRKYNMQAAGCQVKNSAVEHTLVTQIGVVEHPCFAWHDGRRTALPHQAAHQP